MRTEDGDEVRCCDVIGVPRPLGVRCTGTEACNIGTNARAPVSARCTGGTRVAVSWRAAAGLLGQVTFTGTGRVSFAGGTGGASVGGSGGASFVGDTGRVSGRGDTGFISCPDEVVPLTPGAVLPVMPSPSDRVGRPGVSGGPSPGRGVTGAAGRTGLLVVVLR